MVKGSGVRSSASAPATRRGVSSRASSLGSKPNASRSFRTALSAAPMSIVASGPTTASGPDRSSSPPGSSSAADLMDRANPQQIFLPVDYDVSCVHKIANRDILVGQDCSFEASLPRDQLRAVTEL